MRTRHVCPGHVVHYIVIPPDIIISIIRDRDVFAARVAVSLRGRNGNKQYYRRANTGGKRERYRSVRRIRYRTINNNNYTCGLPYDFSINNIITYDVRAFKTSFPRSVRPERTSSDGHYFPRTFDVSVRMHFRKSTRY